MNIGYSKIGRCWNLDINKISVSSGEDAVVLVLQKLSKRFPEHNFYIIGHNSGEIPQNVGYDTNVLNGIEDVDGLDHWIVWAGSNSSGEDHTSELLSDINVWQQDEREVIWLSGDAKTNVDFGNRLLHYPHKPVLSQYDVVKTASNGLDVQYVYSGLEFETLVIDKDPLFHPHFARRTFGIIMNEASKEADETLTRKYILKKYVLDTGISYELFGKWSPESKAELGIDPSILAFSPEAVNAKNQEWLATITTPPSGDIRFVSPKPWEAFAGKTVCFFHPSYDVDNKVFDGLSEADATFLRLTSPDDLSAKIKILFADTVFYDALSERLYQHFINRYDYFQGGIKLIVDRLI